MSELLTKSVINGISETELEKLLNNNILPGFISVSERKSAFTAFEQLGLPAIKHEEWKYAPLRNMITGEYNIALADTNIQRENIEALKWSANDAINLVIVNGYFSASLSDEYTSLEGVNISPLSQSDSKKATFVLTEERLQEQALSLLNRAFAGDGLSIQIEKNVIAEKALHLIFINTSSEKNSASFPYTFINAEQSSSIKIAATYQTLNRASASTFCNSLTEIRVAANAEIEYELIQDESTNSVHVNRVEVEQNRDSRFSINTFSLNGGFIRNDLNIRLAEQGCETHLYGLYLPQGNELVDNHTVMDHDAPHCQSNELYKGVINDKATAVFNGKVFVRQDAQKTNAFQENKNILLSDDAHIYAKPQLEIFADDVKCSHGATTGEIDSESLFYLRSRGIGEEMAKEMLIHAFAADVLENIRIPELRESLLAKLSSKLQTGIQN